MSYNFGLTTDKNEICSHSKTNFSPAPHMGNFAESQVYMDHPSYNLLHGMASPMILMYVRYKASGTQAAFSGMNMKDFLEYRLCTYPEENSLK